MQHSRIIPGRWYQTKMGAGLCLTTACNGVKVKLEDGKTRWLKLSDVQHEIAEGQEPKIVPEKAPRPDKRRDERNEVERCQALLKACFHGMSLAVHHLETGIPIAPASLDNLKAIIAKMEAT